MICQLGYTVIYAICEKLKISVKDHASTLNHQAEAREYFKRRSDQIAAAKFDARLKEALQKKADLLVMQQGHYLIAVHAIPHIFRNPAYYRMFLEIPHIIADFSYNRIFPHYS